MIKKILGSISLLLFFLVACKNPQPQGGKNGGTEGGDTNKTATLTKITIGTISRTGDQIRSEMDFALTNEKKVKVEVETSPSNAEVTYKPELQGGFWNLTLNEDNELEISVKVQGQTNPTVYKAKIRQEVSETGYGKKVDKDIINYVQIEGLAIDGQEQMFEVTQLDEILEGRDFLGELKGPVAIVKVGWSTSEQNPTGKKPPLKKVTINGQNMPKGEDVPYADYEYVFTLPLPMNDTVDVTIDAENAAGAKTQVVFKILRREGTVDIPGTWMYLDEDAVIENNQNLKNFVIADGGDITTELDGDDPTKITVGLIGENLLESIEIEGTKGEFKTKKINIWLNEKKVEKDFYYIEKSVQGISPNGKEVKIILTPKDKTGYTTTTLGFKINYYPPSKNPDFATEAGDPIHDEMITWHNSYDNKARDFYGAKKLTMSLYTKVSTTKVFYRKILLFWEKDSSGNQIIKEEKYLTEEVELEYQEVSNAEPGRRYKHTLKDFELDKHQKTTLRFFTRSKDGQHDQNTGIENAEKGSIDFEYNPIKVKWDYAKKEKGKLFENYALDTIEITKASVVDNKIHVVFRLYDEMEGFKIDPNTNPVFTRIADPEEPAFAWMHTEFDVSELLKDTGAQDELELTLPIKEKIRDKDQNLTGEWLGCFDYKVKVKLKK